VGPAPLAAQLIDGDVGELMTEGFFEKLAVLFQ
jgi:hypothetical protein